MLAGRRTAGAAVVVRGAAGLALLLAGAATAVVRGATLEPAGAVDGTVVRAADGVATEARTDAVVEALDAPGRNAGRSVRDGVAATRDRSLAVGAVAARAMPTTTTAQPSTATHDTTEDTTRPTDMTPV